MIIRDDLVSVDFYVLIFKGVRDLVNSINNHFFFEIFSVV